MKQLFTEVTALGLLVVLALGLGCNRSVAPPTPFTEAELPGAIETAFSAAKQPEAKDLADQVLNSLKAKDYSKAFWAIQTLASVQGLSKEQANVAARARLTINSLLQAAQAAGDTQAAQTVKRYMENK
jgi:hypothetical protein